MPLCLLAGGEVMGQMWQYLQAYLQPNETQAYQAGSFPAQASVLVLLTNDDANPELIFTLRAQHLSSHPGEVSFPGGMWEPQDVTLVDTALRESYEEVGVLPEAVTLLGACRPRSTRAGIRVTPFVGVIDVDTVFVPNPAELDAIFRVPLAAFVAGIQTRTDVFSYADKCFSVPVYQYLEYEIWGFTAAITNEIIAAITTHLSETLPIP